jgi:hypothetical protein
MVPDRITKIGGADNLAKPAGLSRLIGFPVGISIMIVLMA